MSPAPFIFYFLKAYGVACSSSAASTSQLYHGRNYPENNIKFIYYVVIINSYILFSFKNNNGKTLFGDFL